MHWITDEDYAEQMRTEVEPYLAARLTTGYDERVPGQPIYYEHYRADEPKGVIVVSHGFTESVRKFTESIYYMLQAGYEVWGLDHRGHGRSYRPNSDPLVVHAEHFEDYVLDLEHLVRTLVKPAAGELPLALYCHSMGGCIGARVAEEYPGLVQKLVLSSPMLGLSFGKLPLPLVYAVVSLQGIGEKGEEPPTPVSVFPEERFEDSAATSECRFRYYYEKKLADKALQTCTGSRNWGREAIKVCYRVRSRRETAKIRIPVLLFQAGRDSFVKNDAQNLFASRVRDCELVRIPEAKHELYMTEPALLYPYWEKIFGFLKA